MMQTAAAHTQALISARVLLLCLKMQILCTELKMPQKAVTLFMILFSSATIADCRYWIWVTFKNRCKQAVYKKKKSDMDNKSELGNKSCQVNPTWEFALDV